MDVPDINTTNFYKDKKACQNMIDYAVNVYEDRVLERNKNIKMYDSYNGIIDKKKISAITKRYGQASKVPFRSMRIGRTKIKQLVGEHLRIPIKPSIVTLNPEARAKKLDERIDMLGLSHAKPMIEKARSMGMNVYDGINIPAKEDLEKFKNLKSTNEYIMQIILQYKLKNENIHLKLNEAFKYATQTSMMTGVIERTEHGRDEYRAFPPENAIFLESENDFMVKRSPIHGEKRLMYKSEIIKELNLNEDEIKKLDNIEKESLFGDNKNHIVRADNVGALFPVYFVEWDAKRTTRRKYSYSNGSKEPNVTYVGQDYYNKNEKKIKKEVKQGKYKIEEEENWTIFRGARVGSEFYAGIGEAENLIKWVDPNGYEHTESNYQFMLIDTLGGNRVPIQEVIESVSMMYDTVMYLSFREINKFKGDHIVVDKAFLTKGTKTSKFLYGLAEDGYIEVNSSAEGNRAGVDSEAGVDKIVKSNSLSSGLNHIQNLIAIADKLERVLDNVTGMNRDRTGISQASSTATANHNNVQASRDMTYELFYYANIYSEKVLSNLLEKTKINSEWLNTENGNFILSDDEYNFLTITSDISNDSYGVLLEDGKKDMEIIDQMLPIFMQEVNARKLRSFDVIKFMRSAGLSEGLMALEEAYKVVSEVESKSKMEEIKSNERIQASSQKQNIDQREDLQKHELEKIIVKGKIDENKEITKGKFSNGIVDKQLVSDLIKQKEEINSRLEEIDLQNQAALEQTQEQGMQKMQQTQGQEQQQRQ